MSSRDKILAAVSKAQPQLSPLPDMLYWEDKTYLPDIMVDAFTTVASNIGSTVIRVKSVNEIGSFIRQKVEPEQWVVTSVPELFDIAQNSAELFHEDPHQLESIELAILKAQFAVAENSACWLTEEQMGIRVLPFICQHLALVVDVKDILPDMHQAYIRIASAEYGFGAFIAGPSKTADIEQSLVLGAHGPRSLTVFLVG